MKARLSGQQPNPIHLDFPGIEEGIRGLAFVDTCLASARSQEKWTKMIE